MKRWLRVLLHALLFILVTGQIFVWRYAYDGLVIFRREVFTKASFEETYQFEQMFLNALQARVHYVRDAVVYQDSHGEEIGRGEDNFVYQIVVVRDEQRNDARLFTNLGQGEDKAQLGWGQTYYCSYDPQNPNPMRIESNFMPDMSIGPIYDDSGNILCMYVNASVPNFDRNDSFKQYKTCFDMLRTHMPWKIAALAVALALTLWLAIALVRDYARRHAERPGLWGRMYLEIPLLLLGALFWLHARGAFALIFSWMPFNISWKASECLLYLLLYTLALGTLMSIAWHAHARRMRDAFFIGKVARHIGDVYKIVLLLAALCILNLSFGRGDYYAWLPLVAIVDIFACGYVIYRAFALKRISKVIRRISQGDVSAKVGAMPLAYAGLAKDINHIGEGLADAVQEQVQAERLKADLITNVSHDLKTPLTSIINYTQLLKKQPLESETVRGYVAVLDEKSQKLKKLTEDLISLSKLTSGNEKAVLERRNFAEIVMQANGEYAERFDEKNLELRSSIAQGDIYAMIDGDKMWRVLDNLYGNVCKYALPGTRVYMDLYVAQGTVTLHLMNISAQALNVPAQALLERFARGDHARSTEGNGLGLSIAQNLVELQGGTFAIDIRGDLFTVTITLEALPAPAPEDTQENPAP